MSDYTIAQIVAEPTAYGIEFVTEPVEHKKIVLKGAQIPVVRDLDKFVDTFGPNLVLAALDGSSLRVSAQRICRNALWGDHGAKPAALQEQVVAWMLGAKRSGKRTVVVEREVYLDINGGQHETKEAARAASLAIVENE